VSRYDDAHYPELTRAAADVQEVAAELERRGFRADCLLDPTDADVRRELRTRLGGFETVVIYWAGHGVSHGEHDLRLVVRDTGPAAVLDETYDPAALVDRALHGGARQVLLILDTCYSGSAAVDVLRVAAQFAGMQSTMDSEQAWVGVVASAQSYEEAVGGRFAGSLVGLLRDGPSGAEYRAHWSAHNAGVRGVDLLDALRAEWPHQVQQPWFGSFGWSRPILLNPRYAQDAPDRLIEALTFAARGTAPDEDGWYFTGRRRLLGEIVAWLAAARCGLFVVTGPAGSGKSALVGRIAALSDPAERAGLLAHGGPPPDDPDPGEGSVEVALHAHGLGPAELLDGLARGLGLGPAASIHGVLDGLVRAGRRPVVVLDALDEAQPAEVRRIVEELLVPLGRHARVLVGTRRRTLDGAHDLVDLLGAGAVLRDLADEPDTAADVAGYTAARLAGTGNTGVEDIAAEVARRGGDGGFLYARMVTSRLRTEPVDATRPDWERALADSVAAAFDQDLHSLDTVELSVAFTLLATLACAAGQGMPARDVWPALAREIADLGIDDEADVDLVLRTFGRYIVESGEDGQAVYRLFHQQLVDHLQPDFETRSRVDLEVGRLIYVQSAGGRRPDAVNPYLRRHAAEHLFRVGAEGLDALRVLARVNPDAFRDDLVTGLTYHTYISGGVGDYEEAATAAEEAVAILQAVAGTDPARRARLAEALLIVDKALSELDVPSSAAAESVAILRELSAADPVEHRPMLAVALDHHANRLAADGRGSDAVAVAREAVGIARRLAEADRDLGPADLARALHNLSNRLSAADRDDEALAAAEEAVGLLRRAARLDRAEPAELAQSLTNLSGRLAGAGRTGEALAAAEEAVAGLRDLVEHLAAVHRPALARALHTLSGRLTEAGRLDEALERARECVAEFRRLAAERPGVHGHALAQVLRSVAGQLAGAGRPDEAVAALEESLDLCRGLVETDPGRFGDLALAVVGLVSVLTGAGRPAEAQRRFADVLADTPGASPKASLLLRRLALLPQRALPDRFDDAARALELLESPDADDPDDDPAGRHAAHAALRELRRGDPAAFGALWRPRFGAEPAWLNVDDELIDLATGWLACPDWAASKAYAAASPALLGAAARIALDELTLEFAEHHNVVDELARLRSISAEAETAGLDRAFEPLLAAEIVRQWVDTADNAGSAEFLRAHRAELLAPAGRAALRAWRSDDPDDAVLALHEAVLDLVPAGLDERAYAYLRAPDLARATAVLADVLADDDPDHLRPFARFVRACAAVAGDANPAIGHDAVLLGAAASGSPPVLEPVRAVRPELTPAETLSWVGHLGRLAVRRPRRAADLLALSNALTDPDGAGEDGTGP
jgi:tetratricopeptide (TPR) repeat protein